MTTADAGVKAELLGLPLNQITDKTRQEHDRRLRGKVDEFDVDAASTISVTETAPSLTHTVSSDDDTFRYVLTFAVFYCLCLFFQRPRVETPKPAQDGARGNSLLLVVVVPPFSVVWLFWSHCPEGSSCQGPTIACNQRSRDDVFEITG